MNWLDILIVVFPVFFVLYMGWYSRRFVRSVADFLSAGRVCGRYVLCVADVATGLGVITLLSFVEVHYKTGFAMSFWSSITLPLSMLIALTGYCTYRLRETKAMSIGQFFEMRYNRSLRIFASSLRTMSEMLTNMICPALAARFFIYFFDLPHHFSLFGLQIPTLAIVVVIVLTAALFLIFMGGSLALVITDTIQGLFCYPMIVIFIVFILMKFSWSKEIIPVMNDRVTGESFLNPYDVKNLRDFNVFMVVLNVLNSILNRAAWFGGGAGTTAARNPHEQKMAGVLGAWRTTFQSVFYVLIAVMILTLFNHINWREEARICKVAVSHKAVAELVSDKQLRAELDRRIAAIPVHHHRIGVDAPLAQKKNLDTPYLDTVHSGLLERMEESQAHHTYQQFRTLYHQLMLPIAMRRLLPHGLMGAFCLLIILMMISTDDSRIYSSALTITQDIVMPLLKKPLAPKAHLRVIRLVAVCVGIFFFFGSFFMSQLDYIALFTSLMISLWTGGSGPVMVFGLYSRFGTSAGAFASLFVGMGTTFSGMLLQRNWADHIYPFLKGQGMVESIGNFLSTVSAPLNPWIVWTMNPVKCPINSYEFSFMAMVLSLTAYCVVSLITLKQPFNLERMLHRGKYSDDGKPVPKMDWSLRNVFSKIIGITPEYSFGDRLIAYGIFSYSFLYRFVGFFLVVALWNAISPWPKERWSIYFLIVFLIVPGFIAAISSVWFTIGGIRDLRQLFRDLRTREIDVLDNGRVEGNMSISDKARFERIEREGK